jgi:hypothetical protein
MNELDLLDDNVVDVVNGRNFDDGSLESEKKLKGIMLALVVCMIRVVINMMMMRR